MKIGAYAVERDYSHYVAYAAKTVFAVIGTANKGPVGKAVYASDGKTLVGYEGVATVCTSTQDLVNKFGALSTDHLALYAGQYFLSQASKLYFVRAVSSSAKAAAVSLPGTLTGGTTKTDVLSIDAADLGTYANGYTITVTKSTITKSDEEDKGVTYVVTTTSDDVLDTAGNIVDHKVSITKEVKNPSVTTVTDPTYVYTLVFKTASGSVLESIKSVSLEDISGKTFKYFKVGSPATNLGHLTSGIYSLSGGDSGDKDITAADYERAAKALLADQVDMNLFATPIDTTNAPANFDYRALVSSMLTLAETREDCLYLVDPPKDLDRDGVVSWAEGNDPYTGTALNSSYGALYYDWATIYDPVNKKRVNVPPSVVVAATIAYSDRISELWYAPAGLNRGIVRGVLDSVTKLSKADTEYLYEHSINSLYDDPQVGLVVWGQKTLHKADTALNRVNVRRLMNYLKRVVVAACNYLTFEPNDRITWNNFKMKIVPTLENIKNKRGLYEYRVIKGDTIVTTEDIDNYRMPCMIMIRPTKAAEEIPIYFTITSTGADFNEVLEANGVVSD